MTLGRGAVAGLLAVVCVAGGAVWWSRASGAGATAAPSSVDALERQAKDLYQKHQYDQAADAYLEAATQAEQAGDARRARALRSQSAIPLKMAGRVEEARALLLPALEAARAEKDDRSEGLALGNLARVEDLSGNPTGALAYRDALVELAVRTGDTRLEVWTLEQAAANAALIGDVDGAPGILDGLGVQAPAREVERAVGQRGRARRHARPDRPGALGVAALGVQLGLLPEQRVVAPILAIECLVALQRALDARQRAVHVADEGGIGGRLLEGPDLEPRVAGADRELDQRVAVGQRP
ncbi:MAG TPA: hypothetical protein VFF36_11080, partial [Planctomycetota bacterium]|nr:hypothetical protein [Planctomycetota bacterium]